MGVVVTDKAIVLADRLLYGFDPKDGKMLWAFGEPGSVPAQSIPVAAGAIIVSGSLEGTAYGIVAETGTKLWSRSLRASGVTQAVAFDPVVADSLVLLGVAERGPRYRGGVAALRLSDGTLKWYSEFAPRAGIVTSGCHGLVSVADTVVAATSSDGQVHALHLQTGKRLWSAPPDGLLLSSEDLRYTAFVGALLVVGSQSGYLTAYDATTGVLRWRSSPQRGSVGQPLASDNRFVYAVHSGGQLSVVDAQDGRPAWRFESRGMAGMLFYAVSLDSSTVFGGGPTGYFAIAK